LWFDQYRNGRVAERNGFGVSVDKMTLTDVSLAKALGTVLTDDRFAVVAI
jgi:UDP:flavonoid glycosyltransferase YjiC (YdhE family)